MRNPTDLIQIVLGVPSTFLFVGVVLYMVDWIEWKHYDE